MLIPKKFFFLIFDTVFPLNQKGPPLCWKFWKIDQKPFLIAQKKRSDALNATQKTPALYKVWILKKLRIA